VLSLRAGQDASICTYRGKNHPKQVSSRLLSENPNFPPICYCNRGRVDRASKS
jgi:hypothetical protein